MLYFKKMEKNIKKCIKYRYRNIYRNIKIYVYKIYILY